MSTTSSRGAFAALTAAFLGWLFDGFEMGLFPLIGKPALQDLLPAATVAQQGQWFTVIIAVFLVGAATGGVLFGWLGDKLGRVKAMTLAIFTYAIFTGLCAFVTEAWQFAGLRFVASLGMGGEWALGVALVNELWPGKNRAWIAGMIGAASNIGFLLTGVLSLYLNASLETVSHWISAVGLSQGATDFLLHNRGWRFLAVSGALPALINFFILIFVPESHKWEAEKKSGSTSHWATIDLLGVLVAALAALGIITIWTPQVFEKLGNMVAVPLTFLGLAIALWGYLHPVRRYMTRANASRGMLHSGVSLTALSLESHSETGSLIVRSVEIVQGNNPRASADVGDAAQMSDRAVIMRNLLVGAGLAAVALLGTWGSAQQAAKWASFLSPDGTKSNVIEYVVIATALGAILITVITPLVADKLGRRITYFMCCVLALGSAIVFFKMNDAYTGSTMPAKLMITAFLVGGLTASFYGFFPLYFPELFPTSVRATGQGFCFNFGRLIAAIGSLQFVNLVSLFGSDKVAKLEGDARRIMQSQIEGNAFSVLSCVYLVGMVLIWFAPETKGRALA